MTTSTFRVRRVSAVIDGNIEYTELELLSDGTLIMTKTLEDTDGEGGSQNIITLNLDLEDLDLMSRKLWNVHETLCSQESNLSHLDI